MVLISSIYLVVAAEALGELEVVEDSSVQGTGAGSLLALDLIFMVVPVNTLVASSATLPTLLPIMSTVLLTWSRRNCLAVSVTCNKGLKSKTVHIIIIMLKPCLCSVWEKLAGYPQILKDHEDHHQY